MMTFAPKQQFQEKRIHKHGVAKSFSFFEEARTVYRKVFKFDAGDHDETTILHHT